jgi:hypothetical protein
MEDESKKLGQDSAFARPFGRSKYKYNESSIGMNKRFYAACAAMQGIIASNNSIHLVNGHEDNTGWHEPIGIVKCAYEFADELLKQE